MTPNEFYELDEMEQAEAVWEGTFIADRLDSEHKILLYQLGSLYVEAYYDQRYNNLRKFNAFCNVELLEPYLEKIDILKRFNDSL